MKSDSGDMKQIAVAARQASLLMADADSTAKNRALSAMARMLREQAGDILKANRKDVERGRDNKLSEALLDRLLLTEARIEAIAKGVEEVIALPDPIGEISTLAKRPNGMLVGRMRIPLGVILMIYEARPGVAADAASLCLKAGNAVILRGGSDAADSNRIIGRILQAALREAGLPADAVAAIDDVGHESMTELLTFDEEIDLVIPRGGEGLIRFVVEKSRIPVLKHYKGVCHLFIDRDADAQMAVDLALNGKVQRPGVCNAVETILFHEDVSERLAPLVCRRLAENGVTIRGDERTRQLFPDAVEATEADWYAEYLDLVVASRVVRDLDEAVDHIRKYGSNHTEAIVTNNHASAMEFVRRVGSSTVLVNASTRLADGNQLGLGAEIGISTTRLHAYGPMGLEGLTTQKFVVFGNGQVRR